MHFTNEFKTTSMFSSCVSMFFPLILSIFLFFWNGLLLSIGTCVFSLLEIGCYSLGWLTSLLWKPCSMNYGMLFIFIFSFLFDSPKACNLACCMLGTLKF